MEPLSIPYETGRVVILGDLHLDSYERQSWDPIARLDLKGALNSADALILAGDLINGPGKNWSKVFHYLAKHILPEKIYAFHGNHDYYNGSLDDDGLLENEAEKTGA